MLPFTFYLCGCWTDNGKYKVELPLIGKVYFQVNVDQVTLQKLLGPKLEDDLHLLGKWKTTLIF